MKFLSVDRIENSYVICEDESGEAYVIHAKNLPPNLSEGNILSFGKGGEIRVDKRKTNIRRSKISNLRRKIFGKAKNSKRSLS